MIVYLATNTVNGMQYVGLTRRTVLERRVFEHRSSSRRGAGKENTLAHAMRTYGEDVFSFRVIQRVQGLKALSAAERYWIREYNTNWPNGYNVKKGGCHTDPLTTGKRYRIQGKTYYTGNNRTHMIRIPDPGRFELRLMDGSANPYLLQASVLAAGLDGLKNKIDPGKPLNCNMYEDHEKYPNLPKLPDNLDQSLEKLKNIKGMNDAFGKEVINSYIKLRNSEINEFKQKESFDKTKAITRWERDNTLDC